MSNISKFVPKKTNLLEKYIIHPNFYICQLHHLIRFIIVYKVKTFVQPIKGSLDTER